MRPILGKRDTTPGLESVGGTGVGIRKQPEP